MQRLSALLTLVLALAVTAMPACNRSPEARKARHLERGEQYFNDNKLREAIIEYRNVLAIEPANAEALKKTALAHLELGEAAPAIPFLLRAKEAAPDDVDVRLKLATLYLGNRMLSEAREDAAFVLEKQPDSFEALMLYAGSSEAPDEVEEAMKRLESRRGELEGRARFHLSIAALHLRRGDREEAEREMKEAVTRQPGSVEARTTLATYYLATRRFAEAEEQFRKAAELSPINSQARMNLIEALLTTGQTAEARRLLTETTKNAPDFLPAWHRTADLALGQERLDDAKIAIDTILEKNAEDLEGLTLLGRLHLAEGKPSEAKQELQRALRAEPKHAPARYQLALAHIAEGNPAQARTALAAALEANPQFQPAKLLLAQLNLRAKAFQPAIDALEELVEKQPGKAEYWMLLGSAYLGKEEPEEALERYRRFQRMVPESPHGPFLAGMTLRSLGKTTEALGEFEAVLRLDPGHAPALRQIITEPLSTGDIEGALRRVEEQVAKAPQSGKLQHMLGGLHSRKGDEEKAEEAFLKALELEPTYFDPYLALANLYARGERFEEAFARLEDAAAARPKDPSPHMLTAVVQERRGDVGAAKAAYERALERAPSFGPAANNLAYILAEEGGEDGRALELAQIAKTELPDEPRVSDTLGWVLYKRGVYERALRLLNEAAEKLPEDPEVQYHLGMTHYRLGNHADAKEALSRAVASKKKFSGAGEAKQVLDELG